MELLASGVNARALARAIDGSELVLWDEERDLVYAWNGSLTVNVYGLDGVTVDMWMVEEPVPSVSAMRQQIRDRIVAGL